VDPRFYNWLSELIGALAGNTTALTLPSEPDRPDFGEFRVNEALLPVAHFFLERAIVTSRGRPTDVAVRRSSRDFQPADLLVKMWYSMLAKDVLAVSWVARFARLYFDRLTSRWRNELLDVFSNNPENHSVSDILTLLFEAARSPLREAESLTSPYLSKHHQLIETGFCTWVLKGATLDDITSEFETAVFHEIWEDRIEVGKLASEMAAALPIQFGLAYFQTVVKHAAFPGTADIAAEFILRAHLQALFEICRTADTIIAQNPAKLALMIRAMMPNLLRLKGSVEPGCDLVVAWIKAAAINPSQGLREQLFEAIEAGYWLLELDVFCPRIAAAILAFVAESFQADLLKRLELN
jgi:hypothetical protein